MKFALPSSHIRFRELFNISEANKTVPLDVTGFRQLSQLALSTLLCAEVAQGKLINGRESHELNDTGALINLGVPLQTIALESFTRAGKAYCHIMQSDTAPQDIRNEALDKSLYIAMRLMRAGFTSEAETVVKEAREQVIKQLRAASDGKATAAEEDLIAAGLSTLITFAHQLTGFTSQYGQTFEALRRSSLYAVLEYAIESSGTYNAQVHMKGIEAAEHLVEDCICRFQRGDQEYTTDAKLLDAKLTKLRDKMPSSFELQLAEHLITKLRLITTHPPHELLTSLAFKGTNTVTSE
jgi:hypothetical protein